MARSDPQVNFRIPKELLDRVKASAQEEGRTITAELVARLDASFQPGSSGAGAGSNPEVDIAYTLLQSSNRMLDASMYYLKEMAALIPADHPDAELVARIREFAEVMGSKNLIETAETLSKMVEIGIKAGAIDPDTGKPRNKP